MIDPQRPQDRRRVIGAIGQAKRRQGPQTARMATMVDRQHAIAGVGQRPVHRMPVEIGAHHPAVEQEHDRAVAPGVSQEELAAVGGKHRPRRCHLERGNRLVRGRTGHRA
jgi:hypothetical protein